MDLKSNATHGGGEVGFRVEISSGWYAEDVSLYVCAHHKDAGQGRNCPRMELPLDEVYTITICSSNIGLFGSLHV